MLQAKGTQFGFPAPIISSCLAAGPFYKTQQTGVAGNCPQNGALTG